MCELRYENHLQFQSGIIFNLHQLSTIVYKESRNNMPIYGTKKENLIKSPLFMCELRYENHLQFQSGIIFNLHQLSTIVYKESRNNMPIYGYMLPNLSLSPNLFKVKSVYNNNVVLHEELSSFSIVIIIHHKRALLLLLELMFTTLSSRVSQHTITRGFPSSLSTVALCQSK